MKPPACSVRNSSSFPRPSSSGRATTVASNSSQSSDPASRLRSHRFRTSQLPIQKSKSVALDSRCSVSLTVRLPCSSNEASLGDK